MNAFVPCRNHGIMEGRNNTFIGSAHNISASLASLEQIKSKTKNANEERAVFRQQSILLKCFDERLADDIAMRNSVVQQYSIVTHCQDFHEDLKNLVTDNQHYKNFDFPKADVITCAIDLGEHNMFKEVCMKSTHGQMENECFLVDKQISTHIKHSSYKSRNTMGNFLHGATKPSNFSTARQMLVTQALKKQMHCDKATNQECIIGSYPQKSDVGFNFSASKKSLGSLGRLVNSARQTFISPKRKESVTNPDLKCDEEVDSEITSILSHPALKNIDPKMVELINNEIIHEFKPVDWNEIAGLHYAKSIIKEAVVYPLLRPDIFIGLRRPPRGILLFGPPGTGKTLIGKCIASQSSSTFFTISSASLTSKWMGDGEKMVRALFAVAVARQPSVIFIDEIDALLSQRSETENEGTRRLKTEFLVRLDGTSTSDDDRILIVGATNRPQELDEAVRRRFIKRLYVPLPEEDARAEILSNLLKTVENDLDVSQIEDISKLTEGYSGADMDSLCREASMEPLRSLSAENIITYPKENLRQVNVEDFYIALKKIRPSVSQSNLNQLVEWNKIYGSSF